MRGVVRVSSVRAAVVTAINVDLQLISQHERADRCIIQAERVKTQGGNDSGEFDSPSRSNLAIRWGSISIMPRWGNPILSKILEAGFHTLCKTYEYSVSYDQRLLHDYGFDRAARRGAQCNI
jgi:hypothetical protein